MSLEEELNKEFRKFFDNCKTQKFSSSEMKVICKCLEGRKNQLKQIRIELNFMLLAIMTYFLYMNCDKVAWFVTALGRLFLIQLLPYWDWTPLYNKRCLIESGSKLVDSGFFYKEDCSVCGNDDKIDFLSNTSFSYIEENYLEQGLPVIVTDTRNSFDFDSFIETLNSSDLIENTNICNLETNLVIRKYASLENAFGKMRLSENHFLHWRNCNFKALKESRKLIEKPYFYPFHLEPYYSSWFLISKNYFGGRKYLQLEGLIFVNQLEGRMNVVLEPKEGCSEVCVGKEVILQEGDSLVFLSEFWNFAYINNGDESLTTVIDDDTDRDEDKNAEMRQKVVFIHTYVLWCCVVSENANQHLMCGVLLCCPIKALFLCERASRASRVHRLQCIITSKEKTTLINLHGILKQKKNACGCKYSTARANGNTIRYNHIMYILCE
ncbi:hypothetical protein ACFFRR_008624 [Megaselia abdita]